MQRVLDVVIAVVILAIPALAVAQTPAASLAASAHPSHYFAAVTPSSSSAPSNPPCL